MFELKGFAGHFFPLLLEHIFLFSLYAGLLNHRFFLLDVLNMASM